MKKVYFVRHGESEGNAGLIGNLNTSPLTAKGRGQAEFVAKRCQNLSIEVIISSPFVRAKETAEIINNIIKKPIEFCDLVVEKRNPSITMGQQKDSDHVQEAHRVIRENFHQPGFRHSDEENFDDLRDRARSALEYLANRSESEILVVTHGMFLRVMAAYLIFGENLTAAECRRFLAILLTENTGMTVFTYDKEDAERPWRLSIWNDHAHLG